MSKNQPEVFLHKHFSEDLLSEDFSLLVAFLLVTFSWLFRGFFVAFSWRVRAFFVTFSWFFRGFFVAPILGKFYAYSPWNSLLILGSWTSAPSGQGCPRKSLYFPALRAMGRKFLGRDVRPDIRPDVCGISRPKTLCLGRFSLPELAECLRGNIVTKRMRRSRRGECLEICSET